MIPGDTQRLVRRHVLDAVRHQVADQSQVRFRAEDPFLLGDVLLENVGLQCAVEGHRVNAWRSAATTYMQKIGTAGPEIVIEVVTVPRSMPANSRSMIGGRVDRHPTMADLSQTLRLIGVTTHQGRHVEGHAEPATTGVQDHLVTSVRLLSAAESGELTDGPAAAAITSGMKAAGERKGPGPADRIQSRVDHIVRRSVHRFQFDARQGVKSRSRTCPRRSAARHEPPTRHGQKVEALPPQQS